VGSLKRISSVAQGRWRDHYSGIVISDA